MTETRYIDTGRIDYLECKEKQQEVFDALIALKTGKESINAGDAIPTLFLCEHPHVYTLGKSGAENNLLVNPEFLAAIGATFQRTDRGGDITYHGPGQLVGYPVLDIEALGMGLKEYIGLLERTVIDTIAEFGISGERSEGATGVWIPADEKGGLRKISAIGVRSSRYVTMHGFSLNVNPCMEYFSYINPCGFTDRGVTSMSAELGRELTVNEVKPVYLKNFVRIMNIKIKNYADSKTMGVKTPGRSGHGLDACSVAGPPPGTGKPPGAAGDRDGGGS